MTVIWKGCAYMETIEERTLTNIALEVRENFKKKNGRLLTVEEAIQLTDEARKATREGKDKLYEKN